MTLEYLSSLQPVDFSQIQFAISFALSSSSLVQFRLCSSNFLWRSLSLSTRAANELLRILRKVFQSRRRLVGACFQLGEGPSWGILRDCKSSHNHREPWFAALLSTGTEVPLRPRTCPVQSVQSGAHCCSLEPACWQHLGTSPDRLHCTLHCSFWLFREWQNAHTKCSTRMNLPMY